MNTSDYSIRKGIGRGGTLRLICLLLLATVLAATAQSLYAAPALPTSFYGTVQFDGAPASVGTTVSAWINGAQIAETTVFDANGTSVYRIDVLGDDPDTPAIEGGVAGDTITFQIAGATAAQSATWERGGYQNLDLTAVSAPVAAFTASLERNVAQLEDGASIVAFSSTNGGSNAPEAAIDRNDLSAWRSAFGQGTNQSLTIALTAGAPHLVDRVVLKGSTANASLKDFTVRVSSTGSNPGDFATIVSGTLPQDDARHEFTFAPVAASYIQLEMANSWSDANLISLYDLDVLTRNRQGGIVSLLEGPPATVADSSGVYQDNPLYVASNAIDSSNNSYWLASTNSDAWIKVDLGGDIFTIDRVRLRSTSATQAINDFDVRVSTTTADDAAFTTVYTGNGAALTTEQEFSFAPVQARYVQIFARTNHGNATNIRVNTLQILTSGGLNVAASAGVGAYVADYSSQSSTSNAANRAIDFSSTTNWSSASGQSTNQWITVRLLGEQTRVIDKIQLQGNGQTNMLKDFEIRVSTTGLDPADFTTVFSGSVPRDNLLHWFTFPPVAAKYVQLYVLNNHGSTSINIRSFRIYSPALGGATVPFTDLSMATSAPLVSRLWDFGDGTTATDANPTHTYAAPGDYTVQLTTTDSNGVSDTATMVYTVLTPPTADFTWDPDPALEGSGNDFSDASTSIGGMMVDWQWQFPVEGSRSGQTVTNINFEDNGAYDVLLMATDSQFMQATVTKSVVVDNRPPVVSVSPTRVVPWGIVWRVGTTVQDVSPIDEASLSCVWDYQDGTTASIPNCDSFNSDLEYTYSTPGTYAATLTVTDKDGGVSSDFVAVTVPKRQTVFSTYLVSVDEDAGLVEIAAKLRDVDAPWGLVANRTIDFSNGVDSASATTDAEGTATALLPYAGPTIDVTVSFAGDTFYEAGSTTYQFDTTATRPKGDIIFVFDESGSMADKQNAVKARVLDIANQLGAAIDFQLGLVGFGRRDEISPYTGYTVAEGGSGHIYLPLTNDVNAFDNAMDLLVSAGFNEPGFNAVTVSTSQGMGFRDGAGACVILITDDDATSNINTQLAPETKADALAALAARNAIFFGIIDEAWGSAADDYGPNVGSLAEVTGGGIWDITNFPNDPDPVLAALLDQCIDKVIETATPDLVVNKIDDGVPTRIGETIDYTITVSNVGTVDATAIVLTDTLPAHTSLVVASGGGLFNGGIVTWPDFSLAPNETATRTLTLLVEGTLPAGTTSITNIASAFDSTLADPDLNPADNLASVDTPVNANQAPVANDDAATTDENTLVSIAVLDNDSDPDGDSLTIDSVDTPVNGVAVINGSAIDYTPSADFSGSDSFSYVVSAGVLTDTATVNVTVNAVNKAPVANDDSATTDEDTPVSIAVLDNDSDPDGDSLTIDSVSTPANGSAVINGSAIDYTPSAGFSGSDSFTYIVSDGVLTDTATVNVTVNAVNEAPVANDDNATTDEDTLVSIAILDNDSDPDGDSLTIDSVGTAANGSAVVNGNAIDYTPNAGFSGSDSFTYIVSDGVLTDTATVNVTVNTVNEAPVAIDDSATTDEDTPVSIAVLGNDSDPDGDTLTIDSVGTATNGIAVINGTAIDYTPNTGFSGSDSFTYIVSDGVLTDTATVNVTVNAVNEAPIANDDSATTDEDTLVSIAILDNDSDPDGDSLTIDSVGTPVNGVAVINGSAIDYTPNAGFSGSDSFTYIVSDGVLTDTATVNVTVNAVNKAPIANDDNATTDEDTPVSIAVLDNDSDPDGDSLTIDSVDTPVNGVAVINGSAIDYTPSADFSGSDSFSYVVSDGVLTDTATVNVTVNAVNEAPVASDDSATTDEDTPVSIAVLDNDSDPDGDTLTIDSVNTPANGSAIINGTAIDYTPSADFSGSDAFTYIVSDGVLTDTATVNVTVNAVNEAPVANDDSATTDENTPVSIAVLDNDSDPDGDSLTIDSVSTPANGSAVINGTAIDYTPNAGFSGSDSFSYTIADGQGGMATGVVLVTVEAPPTIVCSLYPIALHEDTLIGMNPGDLLTDLMNGGQPGNFGWLTWNGSPSVPTLINNLTPPGNSDTYVNPNDSTDHVVSVGDWVQGKPGVSNSKKVRNALDLLLTIDIVVPIWDTTAGQGNNTNYHVVGFAQVRLTDYQLPGQNRISAQFLGDVACADQIQGSLHGDDAGSNTEVESKEAAATMLYLPFITLEQSAQRAERRQQQETHRLLLPLVQR